MGNNTTIGVKSNFQTLPGVPDNQKLKAAELNQIVDFQKAPAQQITGSLDDTDIIIDGTKQFSATIAVAGATRTITANATGHFKGNHLIQRYTFDVDCTLTLVNFDSVGNNTGTITPIPAGTYDFIFYSRKNGINLLIDVNADSEHDYKTWFVDGNKGSNDNNGERNEPFKTLQPAYDARIADGFTGRGVIKIMTKGTYAGVTTTLTELETEIRAEVQNILLTTVSVTDTKKIIFTNFQIISSFAINQTAANDCNVELFETSVSQNLTGSVNDASITGFTLNNSSQLRITNTSPVLIYGGLTNSVLRINGNITLTQAIQFIDAIIFINSGCTINDLTMTRGTFDASGTSLTFIGDFDHTGVKFVRKESITVTGSETIDTGQWATDPSPKYSAGVIKTLVDDLVEAGTDRHLIIAAETGNSDDLIEIEDLNIGDIILVRADTGDTITIKNNDAGATVKILIQGDTDFTLDEVHPLELTLIATNKLVDSRALMKETIKIPIGARDTDHTTGTNKVGFHIDYNFTFVGLPTLEFDPVITDGGPTGTSFIIDINVADIDGTNLASILSTKLSVDAGEFHSSTAATPAVLSATTIEQFKFISIDNDQVGGTIAGKGGFVTLNGFRT
ncbi:MAG: hypothetical protein IID16_00730 [Candidatus Marinimicrobia bacterium]|nr:hypothetical protein [Candidatus Neomarinimicrobiota bacterium]